MRRAPRGFAAVVLVALAALAGGGGGAAAQTAAQKHVQPNWGTTPKRVLIVLFDQMRPEYADRFDMRNFKRAAGRRHELQLSVPRHMGSETVISHNVIVSGQAPKHMGWVDEAYRDSENLLGGGAGNDVGDRRPDARPVRHARRPRGLSEAGRLPACGVPRARSSSRSARRNTPWSRRPAPTGDIAVRLSSRKFDSARRPACANLGGGGGTVRQERAGLPARTPECGRFYIDSDTSNDYGDRDDAAGVDVPARTGTGSFPGHDKAHLGGDVWAADAAMEMMESEEWSGMLVTLGAIDKAGHMWGAHHRRPARHPPGSPEVQTHVRFIARMPTGQFGRMLDKLRQLGELDDTLVVLTADHGATFGQHFNGQNKPDGGDTNWYYGDSVNDGLFNDPDPGAGTADRHRQRAVLVPVDRDRDLAEGSLEGQEGAGGRDHEDAARRDRQLLPAHGDRYALAGTNSMTPRERWWWNQHGQDDRRHDGVVERPGCGRATP